MCIKCRNLTVTLDNVKISVDLQDPSFLPSVAEYVVYTTHSLVKDSIIEASLWVGYYIVSD